MSEAKPDEIPPTMPVLHYATPDADGVPDLVPEVEAMLDARVRPKRIRKHFGRTSIAAKYFEKSMRRRFAWENLGNACESCGRANCPTRVIAHWTVEFPFRWLEWKFLAETPKARFSTAHTLCIECHGPWQRAARWQHGVGCLGVLSWVAIGAIAVGLWATGWTASTTVLIALGAFAAFGVFANFFVMYWGRLHAPRPVRRSLPRDVTFCDVTGPLDCQTSPSEIVHPLGEID